MALMLAVLAAVALATSGCGASGGSGADAEAPLPTVGLGSEFGSTGEPGVISGAADAQAEGADNVDTVVMIGDSITRASTSALYERFELMGLEHVLIQSQNSKRMAVSSSGNPSGVAIANYINGDGTVPEGSGDSDEALDNDHSNELWVVALGTNDINQYSSPDQIAGAVNEVLGSVPDDVPVVWVDTYYRDEPDGASLVNSIVSERLERRGNAVLAPWSFFAVTEGVVSGDGVHPSDSGKDVFAFVVADTVQAFLDR
jgi:lysophospholipase L1-like esterase